MKKPIARETMGNSDTKIISEGFDVLSPQHRHMLEHDSAIHKDVIAARGYQTISTKTALKRLGFSEVQCNVPGLLMPIHSVRGAIENYQFRSNHPRVKDGRLVKYETIRGSPMLLDVHPLARAKLANPNFPLFITEGIKKGDSLVSKDLCAIALIGVWNYRGTNEHGGKTILADWEHVALKGRSVYIVFDSDVMEKQQVYEALIRLKAFLEARGANG